MLVFHHLGVATHGIAKEFPLYATLGYAMASEIFVDEGQGVRGQFLSHAQLPTLELLEDVHNDGPLCTCLRNGIKIYHMAFSVTDIRAEAASLTSQGAKVIQAVRDAVYFDKVCFLMLRNRQLIELVVPRTGVVSIL